MGETKGSSLVHLLVVILSLVAFGFAIAAERRRSTGTIAIEGGTNATYCVYNSDVATGYGIGSFLFLLSSETLLMGVTKCMCFGRPLTPGGDRAWSIIYFVSSWATFLVAEACLIAGAKKNAYHTKYRGMILAQNFSCESLRKGVFIAAAVFVVATMILNIYFYVYFSKAIAAMQILFSVPTTALCVLLTSFALLFYLLWKPRIAYRETRKNERAPEAPGAWPIIGHLHMLGGSKLLHIVLGSLADMYGPIFTVKLGIKPALVVSDSELAKECFTTHDRVFATRPKSIGAEVLGYNYALFGLGPYTPYWRELRKIATLELLSRRRLMMLGHIRQSEVKTSIKEMYEQWVNNNRNGWMSVEINRWFGDITLNVILRMLAGKRYMGEEKESVRFKKAMREFSQLLGIFLVSDGLPFLRWLDLGGYERAMKRTGKEIDIILEGWLEEHKRKRSINPDMVKGSEQDFMDVMLSMLTEDVSGYDPDTIIKATCLVVLSGGTNTTSITLTWALALLLNNPHVLKKAKEELGIQVGRERQVEESDMKNLVYLQAIFKETLRLYPGAPLSVPHESMEDCTVGGYHIPKGTRLVVNLWKIHRDPSVWSNPLDFKPERFLTTHKDVDMMGQHFELIPFGSGRRICPGLNLSVYVMELTLATLLHSFEFIAKEPIDMTESFGLTNQKATPLEVLVAPRLSSNLYE